MVIPVLYAFLRISKYDHHNGFEKLAEIVFDDTTARTCAFNGRYWLLNRQTIIDIYELDWTTSGTHNLIKSISLTTSNLRAIECDGNFIWGNDGTNLNRIDYDGNTLEVIPMSTSPCFGLAFDGRNFYIGKRADNTIHKLNEKGQSILNWNDPTVVVVDMKHDGRYLYVWHNDKSAPTGGSYLNVFDESGNLIRTAALEGINIVESQQNHRSLCFDRRYMYLLYNKHSP